MTTSTHASHFHFAHAAAWTADLSARLAARLSAILTKLNQVFDHDRPHALLLHRSQHQIVAAGQRSGNHGHVLSLPARVARGQRRRDARAELGVGRLVTEGQKWGWTIDSYRALFLAPLVERYPDLVGLAQPLDDIERRPFG